MLQDPSLRRRRGTVVVGPWAAELPTFRPCGELLRDRRWHPNLCCMYFLLDPILRRNGRPPEQHPPPEQQDPGLHQPTHLPEPHGVVLHQGVGPTTGFRTPVFSTLASVVASINQQEIRRGTQHKISLV
jgi:hypothetical protein